MARLPFPVYDADNHLYEPEEAFTRHLPKKFQRDFFFVDDEGWVLSGHLAFSGMLALIPFLIFATALTGLVIGPEGGQAVLLNAGALTHTSLALYDAIRSIKTPVIEVHISNPAAREAYRHHSYVGMAAKGSIAGFGAKGYVLALEAAAEL